MTFTVTYRGADGAVREERVEAASRGECFAQCRTRGIAPMSVKEGDFASRRGAEARRGEDGGSPRRGASDRGGRKGMGQQARKRMVAWALSVAMVALIGGGVWWRLGRGESQPTQELEVPKKAALAKEVKPAAAPKPMAEPVATNKLDMVTLPNGVVTNKPKTIAEAIAMVRLKPGFHRYRSVDEVFSRTNDFQVGEYKKPLFKTQMESHLGTIASMPRDQNIPPMPPMPMDIERDFEKALASMIEVGDGDSTEDVRTKMRVSEMKEKMRMLVKDEGMTVSQAFREIENEHNRRANMTMLYKGAYRKMVLAGDESAVDFLKKANEELRRAGACEFDENAKSINP